MREVYIIGGANIDIIGRSDSKMIPRDSNIGKVVQSYGGVGRNIAENAARLGMKVHFVSVLGNDDNGLRCIQYCEECGMDMSDCRIIENERTSTYLAILDDSGDMSVAINDMDILRFMTREHIDHVFKKIKKEDILVIDTNLDKDVIEYMLKEAPCDVYIDPISCEKAKKLDGLLSYIHTFKPNVYEAEQLSGIKYEGIASLDEMGRYFLSRGIHEIYISLGKEGVKGFTDQRSVLCSTEEIVVANVTGAGDSFMGGVIAASILDYDFVEKIRFAQSCSVCTIETDQSVCRRLSIDFVNQRKNRLRFYVEEKQICI